LTGGNQCRDPLGIAAQNAVTHIHHLGKVMNSVQAESTRPKRFKNLLPGPENPVKTGSEALPCSRAAYRHLSHHFRNSASSATFGSNSMAMSTSPSRSASESMLPKRTALSLQELLQKCFRCLSKTGFAAEALAKASPRDVSSKPDSDNTVLGSQAR
jgi:hypothetical protein